MLDNPNYDKDTVNLLKYSILKSNYKLNPSEIWEQEFNHKIDMVINKDYSYFNSSFGFNFPIISFVGVAGDGKTTLYRELAQEVANDLELNFIENPKHISDGKRDFLLIIKDINAHPLVQDVLNSSEQKAFNQVAAGTVLFENIHLFSHAQNNEVLKLIKEQNYHTSFTVDANHKHLVNETILSRTLCVNSKQYILRQMKELRFKTSLDNMDTALKNK